MWISIDMEGIGGVATYSHVMMKGVEYERARRWMTDEANACIDGAASAGAKGFCVNDSHGAMHNIYADDLDLHAELLAGTAKPWSIGQGIDGGYDTCFFVGYHALAGYFGASLLLVAGDDATCAEARQVLGRDVVTVRTKDAAGRFAAKMLHPTKVCEQLRDGAAEAVNVTRRSGARAVAYGARDYLEVYKAMLAMVRIAPSAVPPEQS